MAVRRSAIPVGDAVRMEDVPDPQVAERAKRRSYSAKYKAEILAEYDAADRDGRGALVGRESLYSSLISEWRKQAGKGALEALGKTRGRPPADPVERENARLLRERGETGDRRRHAPCATAISPAPLGAAPRRDPHDLPVGATDAADPLPLLVHPGVQTPTGCQARSTGWGGSTRWTVSAGR